MTIANAAAAPRPKGPQTPEAKQRVRRNALKHGLRAETLVSDEDRDAVAEKVATWTIELAPEGDVERTLVERAAAAAVRLKRCERAEQAALEESAARAARVWEARARSRARKLGGRLKEDPAAVVEELETSAFGIDWLIGRWRDLRGALERWKKDWNYDAIALMARLLRIDIRVGHEAMAANAFAGSLWRCALSAVGYLPNWEDHYAPYAAAAVAAAGGAEESGPPPTGRAAFDLLPPQESALPALRTVIAREITRLKELRDEVYEEVEAPARAEAIERGLVDTSEEAQRRLRYEQVHERTLHRSLNDLSRRQKERLKAGESAPGEPFWSGGVHEPAPAPNNTAEAPELASVLDDKAESGNDLQSDDPLPAEVEPARTDRFSHLPEAHAKRAREFMEMLRGLKSEPSDEDEDEDRDDEEDEGDDFE